MIGTLLDHQCPYAKLQWHVGVRTHMSMYIRMHPHTNVLWLCVHHVNAWIHMGMKMAGNYLNTCMNTIVTKQAIIMGKNALASSG